ncbi:MAG TPA: glycosyltransferase [Bacteroidia bacterium]|nr:glycosyltransferase [Bacteroidia bacterium]
MKIIFFVSRFPFPLEKGDKLRAFQHIKNLHESGHEIHLIALSDEKVSTKSYNEVKQFCNSITVYNLTWKDLFSNLSGSFTKKLPLQVGYFYSSAIRKKIENLIEQINPDLIYCQLIRTAYYVKNLQKWPLLIDYQDAFSKGTFQRMQKAHWIYKSLFKREFNLVNEFEKKSYDWFDGHIIISDQDKMALNVEAGKEVFVIPNGIDTDYFQPAQGNEEFDITFVGNMNYPPNVDSAVFLVKEIMPVVWSKFPEAKVQIGGANPHKKVRNLAARNVVITGWVDDIRECYKNTKVFIAPMRIGTGLQNKLLEAMAMKIACITTPLSFEPLNAEKGQHILVGDTARDLAGHLMSLLSGTDLRTKLASNGYNFIHENYSLDHSRKQLDAALDATIKNFKAKLK